jgi:prepilin-type N-terminal cleavage/methylation domain-containing protein
MPQDRSRLKNGMAHNGTKMAMLGRKRHTQNGFTITEVLVAMVIASVLITAVYQTFHSQQRSYTVQSEAAAMEQNLRSGLYLLTRELRSAGYNPTQATTSDFRFVTSFPPTNNLFVINYATDHSMVAFTLDTDGSGAIEPNKNEQIAYRFNSAQKTLERFNDTQANPTKKWETVASDIDAVCFTYFDQNTHITTDPTRIEYVEISLLARTQKQDSKYTNTTVYTNKASVNLCPACVGDHYRRRLLTTTIQIRNKLITPS